MFPELWGIGTVLGSLDGGLMEFSFCTLRVCALGFGSHKLWTMAQNLVKYLKSLTGGTYVTLYDDTPGFELC